MDFNREKTASPLLALLCRLELFSASIKSSRLLKKIFRKSSYRRKNTDSYWMSKSNHPLKVKLNDLWSILYSRQNLDSADEFYMWNYHPPSRYDLLYAILAVIGSLTFVMYPIWPEKTKQGSDSKSLQESGIQRRFWAQNSWLLSWHRWNRLSWTLSRSLPFAKPNLLGNMASILGPPSSLYSSESDRRRWFPRLFCASLQLQAIR